MLCLNRANTGSASETHSLPPHSAFCLLKQYSNKTRVLTNYTDWEIEWGIQKNGKGALFWKLKTVVQRRQYILRGEPRLSPSTTDGSALLSALTHSGQEWAVCHMVCSIGSVRGIHIFFSILRYFLSRGILGTATVPCLRLASSLQSKRIGHIFSPGGNRCCGGTAFLINMTACVGWLHWDVYLI